MNQQIFDANTVTSYAEYVKALTSASQGFPTSDFSLSQGSQQCYQQQMSPAIKLEPGSQEFIYMSQLGLLNQSGSQSVSSQMSAADFYLGSSQTLSLKRSWKNISGPNHPFEGYEGLEERLTPKKIKQEEIFEKMQLQEDAHYAFNPGASPALL